MEHCACTRGEKLEEGFMNTCLAKSKEEKVKFPTILMREIGEKGIFWTTSKSWSNFIVRYPNCFVSVMRATK